ncbi:unnamed protein product [Diamesa serratosioi]
MTSNYRSADVFGGPYGMQTPAGIVHTSSSQGIQPPPLPPRPGMYQQQNYSPYSSYGNYGNSYGSSYGMGMNSMYGGLGMGMSGMGGMGGMGYRGGMMNSYGNNPMDPENRFIQMAEENSRPAFQSIESVVNTIGSIAAMLDSTYFALTSSFRAILGVAANFSQLRGFFARFFSSFTIFRSMIWFYKKILYVMGISKTNPGTISLSEAFNEAEQSRNNQFFEAATKTPTSNGWPIMLFIAFIFSAPYLITKLFGSVTKAAVDQTKNPATWVNPVDATALYNFNGEQPGELPIKAGQRIKIAPKEIQQANRLLQTNWLLGTIDGVNCGVVPVNYIQRSGIAKAHVDSNIAQQDHITMEPVLITNIETKPQDAQI